MNRYFPMEPIGEIYEYYRGECIGHGAFALVYRGRNKETKTPIAVKCINKAKLKSSSTLLEKEIDILKELRHENIVQLYECIESEQRYFLILEFCNGGDLSLYLHTNGTLREDTIRQFFQQIAYAMKAMHERGILHRDLKPQNILLSFKESIRRPRPKDLVLKIADFGFARHLPRDTMAETVCGSPIYMAPEVITSQEYNAKADLWSIGTIMYQCLVGKAPFPATSPQELRNFYEKSKKVRPRIPHGTSEVLTDIIERLLKRKVDERINFTDFFNHEFFHHDPEVLSRMASIMLVPERSGESFATPNSSNTSDPRCVVEPSQVEIECSPSVGDPLFLGNSSDEEEFVMIDHPFSSATNVSPQHNPYRSKHGSLRKNSAPSPIHRPVISHRKQSSLGSPRRSLEDRSHSRDLMARSPFMQGFKPGSPITIRYSGGGSSRRKSYSESESDASYHSKPSPVPLPVPTQADNFRKLDRHVTQARSFVPVLEEKRPLSVCRPRSMSPLCINNLQRRCSLDNVPPSPGAVYFNGPRGTRILGSPVEIPPILENPDMAKAQEIGIRCIIDNKSETLVAQLARAWTAPDLARLSGNGQVTSVEKSVGVRDKGVLRPNGGKITSVDDCIEANASILKTDVALGNENSPETEFRFYKHLSDTICEVASEHNMFQYDVLRRLSVSARMDPLHNVTEKQKQGEQLLLYMKALQLVATALHTLRNKVNAGNITVTPDIKDVGKELNQTYKKCLQLCEEWKSQCEITEKSCINFTSADKILYFQALRDCQSATIDEMFESNTKNCMKRYQRSLVLLEGLSLATNNDLDRARLSQFKKGIRTRLEILKTDLKPLTPSLVQ